MLVIDWTPHLHSMIIGYFAFWGMAASALLAEIMGGRVADLLRRALRSLLRRREAFRAPHTAQAHS